ncbi:MAG TPA: ABC transporter permease [Candidatus Hydrogenedentes bacterium]|nr:ABC transporter permease [Candidatus Hydrogenedentota bacterium]
MRGAGRRFLGDSLGLVLVLATLVVFFGLITRHFFSFTTLQTIVNQIPDSLVIAVGMTFVLVIAGIDLSVGSVLALSGAVLGVCLARLHWPLPPAIVACLFTGLLAGTVNGAVTVRWALPSFIVTLGMLEAARGAAYLVTTSQTQYIGEPIERIAEAGLFGISLPFLIAFLIVIIGQTVLSHTTFGRYMLAVGANEETARLSGVPTRMVRLSVFMISGLLASVAAVIHCARMSAADPNTGIGYELNAIAAVVIGGTSLMGGRGSVANTFLGVLIIAVLQNGLVQAGAQDPTKRIVTGAVIVAAVIVDYYRRRSGGLTARVGG